MSSPRRRSALFPAACVCVVALTGFGLRAQERLPSVEELRQRLTELEQARRESRAAGLNWKEAARLEIGGRVALGRAGTAIIEFVHEADTTSCVWTIELIDDDGDARAEPIRLCMNFKGREWIRVPRGRLKIVLRAGEPTGEAIEFPAQTVNAASERFYRLQFGEKEESALRQTLRDRERLERQKAEEERSGK